MKEENITQGLLAVIAIIGLFGCSVFFNVYVFKEPVGCAIFGTSTSLLLLLFWHFIKSD